MFDNSLNTRLIRVVRSALLKYIRYETGVEPVVSEAVDANSFIVYVPDVGAYIVTVKPTNER